MVVVQFSVDLAQESMAPSDTIYLQSTFNGWCGNCAPMARLSSSSNVWVRNETRPDGEWIEWKFTIGVWNITEDVPIECDVTGGAWHNRGIVVSSGVMTLPTVCFSGCGECPVYVTLQHGASRPRAKTLPAWLSRGPSSWLQASRTPRVDFGEEGINMLTVRVSHQMASQI